MPRFKDAPLGKDRFRLFRFLPPIHTNQTSRSDQPTPLKLNISVQTFKIYRAPIYTAISYCWGSITDGTTTITCDDQPLEIWSNLSAALQRLYGEEPPSTNARGDAKWYWCDAISIEQGTSDVAVQEKAQQIAFMETIFGLARPVRVWLGEASPQEEDAFARFAELCEACPPKGVARNRFAETLPGVEDEMWRFWAQVMLRPWFARLWIVQEALLSNGEAVIMFGERANTTWENFHTMMHLQKGFETGEAKLTYDELDAKGRNFVDRDFELEWGVTLADYEKHGRGRTNRNDAVASCVSRNVVNIRELLHLEKYHDANFGFLQQVLKVFGNRKCTYQQDRPNAMRGVLTEKLKKGLRVYGIQADVATVYREVTQVWLTNDPTLSLLQRIRPLRKFLPPGPDQTGTRLVNPSWAIDLSRVVTQVLGDGIPHRIDGFHAGMVRKNARTKGDMEWSVPETSLKTRLTGARHVSFPDDFQCHIAGVELGLINNNLPVTKAHAEQRAARSDVALHHDSDFSKWLFDSFDLIRKTTSDDERAKEIHCRTLVLNQTYTPDPNVMTMFDVDDKHSRRESYDTMIDILKSGDIKRLQHSDPATEYYYWSMSIHRWDCPNWFVTNGGLIGRSYCVPQRGDVVAVFYGAATPFLLRPVEGRDTFEFMGEAYVHSVMQGQALHEVSTVRYPKRIFKLI